MSISPHIDLSADTDDGVRVRLADSIDPSRLLPTPDERAEAARREAERERSEKERYLALLRLHGIEPD